jgi:hypothetical protein
MIDYILRYVLPAASSLLPPALTSPEASAMLLAIGLQESKFKARYQDNGPARGFWQFEEGGVEAVLAHARSQVLIASALAALQYDHTAPAVLLLPSLAHNDVLAACFARCLLWTSPQRLSPPEDQRLAWTLYTDTWRPGKPRRATWTANFGQAWTMVAGFKA